MSADAVARTGVAGRYFDVLHPANGNMYRKDFSLQSSNIPYDIPFSGNRTTTNKSTEIPKQEADEQRQMASDREYVDLKLEVSEARAATRFTQFDGKLDRIVEGLSTLGSQINQTQAELRDARTAARAEAKSLQITVIVTGISIFFGMAALFIAIATYGDALFGRGMSVRDVVSTIAKEQAERASASKSATDAGKDPSPTAR